MHMRRRSVLASALTVAWPARAQPTARKARIGVMVPTLQQTRAARLVKALESVGWRQGENLTVEVRVGDTAPLLDAQAADLVRLGVDVIVTLLTPAVLAARRATSSVPIVMAGAGLDPVAGGLARSLAAPGGNVTGITVQGNHLAAKSLELVSELRAPTRRVGVLANAIDPFTDSLLHSLQGAAQSLQIRLSTKPVRAVDAYAAAFAAWAAAREDAIFVQPSLAIDKAAALALAHRLPAFSFVRGFVAAGGLMSYSANLDELERRAVNFVDRILRGAKPAQLPVEQSNIFDLLLNLRTARTLGVAVPNALILRASEVIE